MPKIAPERLHDRPPSLLLAGFALYWFADTIADPDLWGHVRFGQDILRTGLPATSDAYSYRAAGARWINHEWLSEVAFAVAYEVLGPPGLILLKWLIALAIVALCHRTLRRKGLPPAAAAILLVLVAIPYHMGMGTVRPQLFTYLGFLLLLLSLEAASPGRESRLWPLPALFALWVNLHGGVLAGAGVLAAWLGLRAFGRLAAAGRPWRARLVSLVPLVGLGLACALALLLNPYGPELPAFLIRTGVVPRPEITEWRPIGPGSLPGLLILTVVALGTAGLAFSRRPRTPEALAIPTVAAAWTLLHARHFPLFALTLIVLGGEHLADVADRWCSPRLRGLGRGRVAAPLCLIAAVVLIALCPGRLGCIRIDAAYFPYPARAIALLKASEVRGNLALPFDWGEFALWHLGPGVKVSIDGRRETLYPDEAYRQAMDLERGTGDWDALLRSSPTDLVLLRKGSPTVARLADDPRWLPLYQDSFCVLFARGGLPALGRIVATSVPDLPDDGDRLCFPGAARPAVGPLTGNSSRAAARPGPAPR